MKKLLSLTLVSLLSVSAFANDIALDAKEIDLGNISDSENNMAVIKEFSFKRTADTPKKVTLKYELNFLKDDCTEYEVKTEEIPEFKKTVCEVSNGGAFLCEEKIFSGLFNAKTECIAKGQVRETAKGEVTLNFSGAVKLAPAASETIGVNLTQKSMKEDNASAVGRMIESHSLYKVRNSRIGKEQIIFKAL